MSELISRFTALPASGVGALIVLLLYGLQSEIRFGARARTIRAGRSDRKSTLLVSASSAVPVLGFVLAMKASSPAASTLPQWFRHAFMPGLPGLRIGVIAMKSGSQWQEHKTESRIIVHVIEGHIRFLLKERACELRKGELLMLEPGIPHTVEALEETAFLLTLC